MKDLPSSLGELAWEVIRESRAAHGADLSYKIHEKDFAAFREAFDRRFLERLLASVQQPLAQRLASGEHGGFRPETLRFAGDPRIYAEICDVTCNAVYDYLHGEGFLDLPVRWQEHLGEDLEEPLELGPRAREHLTHELLFEEPQSIDGRGLHLGIGEAHLVDLAEDRLLVSAERVEERLVGVRVDRADARLVARAGEDLAAEEEVRDAALDGLDLMGQEALAAGRDHLLEEGAEAADELDLHLLRVELLLGPPRLALQAL
jgi:hypothetical protein